MCVANNNYCCMYPAWAILEGPTLLMIGTARNLKNFTKNETIITNNTCPTFDTSTNDDVIFLLIIKTK